MPTVTIIVPCYNEQATIGLLLQAIYDQSYPRVQMEVVIADGLSTDQTLSQIQAFTQTHPDLKVRVVENPQRTIPSGLNQALRSALGDIIIRLDAHSIPYSNYVAGCVAALQNQCGENVGGVWEILPGGSGWLAKSIAAAAAHPFGAGDARYRIGGLAQEVDTVPFGAFRRTLIEKVGYFDESLLTNEDYEFNVRIQQSGGKIWMDPQIRTRYFARANLSALWKQYWRYGFWKVRMLRRYPQSLRWRQALPPLFVFSLILFGIFSFWMPFFRWLLIFQLIIYSLVIILAGVRKALSKRYMPYVLGLPLALSVIHLAWGSGALLSMLRYEKP